MRSAAWLAIAVAVVFSGCRSSDWIERTLVTVDVTGAWEGTYYGSGTGSSGSWFRDCVLVLEQRGQRVTGEIRIFGTGRDPSGSYSVYGTVNGDTFSFQESDQFRVELRVNGDEMTGSGQRKGLDLQMNLRRRPQ